MHAALAGLLAVLDPLRADAWAVRLTGAFGSLAALGAASPARIARLVGAPAAALLSAQRRATLLTLREAAVRGPILATRYELLEYLHHADAHAGEERLRAFFLNARRELLAEEVLAHGDVGAVAVRPRDVLARALELGATGLLLVHNHPSGDPTPSAADRAFTRALAAAGAGLGVTLHDHVVVARDGSAQVPFSRGVIDP